MNPDRKIVYLLPSVTRSGTEIATLRAAKFLKEQKGLQPVFFIMNSKCDEGLLAEYGFSGTPVYIAPKGLDWSESINADYFSREILQKELPLAIIETLFSSPIEALEVARRQGVKVIKWVHTMPFYISKLHLSKWELKAKESLLNRILSWTIAPLRVKTFRKSQGESIARVLSHTDQFFVLCQGYKEEIAKELGLLQSEADKILPMINTIERVQGVDLENRDKRIVSIGRLDLLPKRYDRFVEVWKHAHERLPEWSFDIYGWSYDEKDTALLEEWIRESGAPRIHFRGISRNPSEVYASASVSILTSAYEGWPVALMEAQRQGVVPIASNCCQGVEEVIVGANGDKEAGILVSEPFNARRFADKLVELCQNKELRQRLQKNCLDKISDYQPEVNEASWQAFYRLLDI